MPQRLKLRNLTETLENLVFFRSQAGPGPSGPFPRVCAPANVDDKAHPLYYLPTFCHHTEKHNFLCSRPTDRLLGNFG